MFAGEGDTIKVINIEAAMRASMERIQAINPDSYYSWSPRTKDGKVPGIYPEDGFYGDDLRSPEFCINLIYDLMDSMDNGFIDKDSAGSATVTPLDPWSLLPPEDLTSTNYIDVFKNVLTMLNKCTTISRTPSSFVNLQQDSGTGNSITTQEDAIALASTQLATGLLNWSWQDQHEPSVYINEAYIRRMSARSFLPPEYGDTFLYWEDIAQGRGNFEDDQVTKCKGTVKFYCGIWRRTCRIDWAYTYWDTYHYVGWLPATLESEGWHEPMTLRETVAPGASWTSTYLAGATITANEPYDLSSIDQSVTTWYSWKPRLVVDLDVGMFVDDPFQTLKICPCTTGCTGGATVAKNSCVDFMINLGAGPDGSTGYLRLYSETATDTLAQPEALKLNPSRGLSTVRDASGLFSRQITTPQAFVDIVTIDAYAYEVRFYPLASKGAKQSDGTYAVTGTPDRVIHVENVLRVAGPVTDLKITVSTGSTELESQEYVCNGAKDWTLTSDADGVHRVEARHSVTSGATRTETHTISDGVKTFTEVIVYRVFPWNTLANAETAEELVSRTIDPAGIAAQTNCVYYEDSTDANNYGHLKTKTEANGYWETYEYDSARRIIKTTSPFLNSQPGDTAKRVKQTIHHESDNYDEEVESLTAGGTTREVSRTYTLFNWDGVQTIRCQTPGALRTASDNLVSSVAYYDDNHWPFPPVSYGKIYRMIKEDGTGTIYQYAQSGNNLTTTSYEGTFNSGKTAVTTGVKTERVTNAVNEVISETITDIASTNVLSFGMATLSDDYGRVRTFVYTDGTSVQKSYNCCGLDSITDRAGITTSYTYDGAHRVLRETRGGITLRYVYDVMGRRTDTFRIGSDLTEMPIDHTDYDLAGEVQFTKAYNLRTTTYAKVVDESGQTVKTTTNPDGGAQIETLAIDGSRMSVSGTAVAARKYEYGADSDGLFVKEINVGNSGEVTEWTKTSTDLLGRTHKIAFADGQTARSYYNGLGQLIRQTDADGVQTLYAYDGLGGLRDAVADMNRNGQIDLAGTDRITRTLREVGTRTADEGTTFTVQRVTTQGWAITATDTARTLDVTERSADGLRVWQTRNGQTTRTVTAYGATAGARTETTTLPDGSSFVRTYSNGRLATETRRDAAQATVTSLAYGYDSHGRVHTVTDSLAHATTYAYYGDDQPHTVATPDPDSTRTGSGYDAQTTTYHYDNAGRLDLVTQPDGAEAHTTYWSTGQVKRTWGGRAYPQAYTYDSQGRMRTLTTWQDYAGQTGAAVTTWNYDSQRGWLNNKRDNDSKGPDYAYWPSGRLKTRTWQRGVVTTYGYTNAGEVNSITYSDAITPSVSQTYDRLGRPETTTDAAGLLTRSYDPVSLNLAGETYTGSGMLSGHSLTRGYDVRNRPQSLATDTGYAVGYGFDSAGRLDTINQGFHIAKYTFKTGVGTMETVTVKRSGVERVKHERTTDVLGRVSRVKTTAAGNGAVQRDYTYNAANQRTQIAQEDTREWAYGYDVLGQVTSAQKRLADHTTPLPGYSFGYTFDTIGNRTQTVTNARTSTWTPNLLNRYTSRQVSGAVDVRGEAHADATVTVNTLATTRTGKDFYKEISASNGSTAVNTALAIEAVTASTPPQTVTETRAAFTAQTPESYTHDDDGNLTSDGRWTYTWDGENRLIALETVSAVAAALPTLKQRLEFSYDAQGRRIGKVLKLWNASGSAWTTSAIQRFLYDGWNLITEIDALTVIRTHVWGLDLSGTMQGAGGVGGLLLTNTGGNTFAASCDANGNIVAYINTATAVVAGRADYGAFGEGVMKTGVANTLPFGFSTKYTDKETGLFYYIYRYYDSSTGRWLSRDMIEEQGGMNLYGMVGNNPVSFIDLLGLDILPSDLIGPLQRGDQRGLSCAQYKAIKELLRREKEHGTIKAARMSSVTFGDKLIEPFNSTYGNTVPTYYGPMDLDWFTDVTSMNYVGIYSALPLYMGGKTLWTGVRKAKKVPIGSAWPFEDPGERAAVQALLDDMNFASLFTSKFLERYKPVCPCDE